jgi:hypothetical protein
MNGPAQNEGERGQQTQLPAAIKTVECLGLGRGN